MEIQRFFTVHKTTNEVVDVIRIKRPLGVRYIVFWKDDAEPTIYTASDFTDKFISIYQGRL